MSFAYRVGPGMPVIWRGPLLMAAVQQMLFDTNWGELDYLVVDLPPGTGDVPLSLVQLVAIDGVVIVTTPQSVAVSNVTRCIEMFQATACSQRRYTPGAGLPPVRRKGCARRSTAPGFSSSGSCCAADPRSASGCHPPHCGWKSSPDQVQPVPICKTGGVSGEIRNPPAFVRYLACAQIRLA